MLQVNNNQLLFVPGIEIIQKMDKPGPRYTSYPTADRFTQHFETNNYLQALKNHSLACLVKPLSIYVHIPFCATLCHYCACHKIATKDYSKSQPYLDALLKEVKLIASNVQQSSEVTQLHLGGGTPTFFTDDHLQTLIQGISNVFKLSDRVECSIEVDPRTVDGERLKRLHQMGFNRISFGIQDFDSAVQLAIHRIQPYEQVATLMEQARDLGFKSINVDLIYGLPKQTAASFRHTLEKISGLRPERVAVYAYAHLPERFKAQRLINPEDLPSAQERVSMLHDAITVLGQEGWEYIGMDHFSLPSDTLAIAKKNGCLHRNFQGYSTHADCDLIGLGVSAISKIGQTYAQNHKDLTTYYDSLAKEQLPIVRGYQMNRDDLVRQAVIMHLMCQGNVYFEAIEQAYLIKFDEYFSSEIQALDEFVAEGLLLIEEDSLQVTEAGWFLVRAIARVFDKHFTKDEHKVVTFSKMV